MKYMHFKASCSYAALANLLERMGVDTEDTEIALGMDLPWLFDKDGDAYLSGPMLQSAEWFNLWLKPRGFQMTETAMRKDALCARLKGSEQPLMLGILTPYGKHAVVFTGYDGTYRFVNPTHEDSGEETELVISETDLIDRVDDSVMLAHVVRTEPEPVDPIPYLRRSVSVLQENVSEITQFTSILHEPDAYLNALNPLFRPLLLDGISMLTLAGETVLADRFTALQGALMEFLRGPRAGRLCDALSIPKLQEASNEYVHLIESRITR